MSFPRSILAGSVVAVLALAGCGSAAETDAEDGEDTSTSTAAPEADLDGLPDVIATVNGDEIGLDEFTEAYETQLQQAAAQQEAGGDEVDQDALKTQVADLLVNNLLLTQAAEDAGYDASDDDVDALLQDIADENGFTSVDEVIAAFAEQGLEEDEVRANAANEVLIDEYIDAKVDIEAPGDDELKDQYDELVAQAEEQGGDTSEIPSFDDAKDQLSEQAVAEDRNAGIEKILEKLREKGEVDIAL